MSALIPRNEPGSSAEFFEQLLVETADAHGRFEEQQLGGERDEEWPRWYGAYMARALAERGQQVVEERRP